MGTDHHPFPRLVRWLDAWATAHPEVRVLLQHGATPAPDIASGVEFLDHTELRAAMAEATAVVCHGGPATIMEARHAGHLPLVVARDPELGEHVDDHQFRFVARLDAAGVARACPTEDQLHAVLDKALAQPDEFRVPPGGAATVEAAGRAGELIDLLRPGARGTGTDGSDHSPAPATVPATVHTTEEPWPDVTVVVPTRDRPELLRHTLRSIVGQDYPGRVRTMVVFDHDDPDLSLADDDPERPVRVLRNTQQPGLAGARNTGILASGTELVAFCDDDDTWLPHKLRHQVELLHRDPNTDLVCCGVQVAYEDTEIDRVLHTGQVELRDLLESRLTELHPSTFLFRTDRLVHDIGLVSETIPGSYGEDYELLLRSARMGVVRNLPEVGARVLWHRNSHFSGRWGMISQALRWLLNEYPEFRLVPRGYARITGQVAFAEAGARRRLKALRWIARTLWARPVEPRAYLALAVSCGLPPRWVINALHRAGKGI
ncbi:glycosyltransferase [Lipingzhangella sp. LS1_29]|uniref:Glycosyltransferase n=1 Tax=Lipingzhangella rawalii TaxID=2055835 RepID=A0ABU2H3D0_9ACTN|nr:glycosyltransferase [Lipingzhangella rawalii]